VLVKVSGPPAHLMRAARRVDAARAELDAELARYGRPAFTSDAEALAFIERQLPARFEHTDELLPLVRAARDVQTARVKFARAFMKAGAR
jgi:hypothetical protein